MKNSFAIVILYLSAFILLSGMFQNCTVYNRTWVSMEEAMTLGKQKVKLGKVVKVTQKGDTIMKYWHMKMHGDSLIGFGIPLSMVSGYRNKHSSQYASPIPEPYRNCRVYLVNKTESTVTTIIVVGIIISPFVLIFYKVNQIGK